jgi:hypothetical protein
LYSEEWVQHGGFIPWSLLTLRKNPQNPFDTIVREKVGAGAVLDGRENIAPLRDLELYEIVEQFIRLVATSFDHSSLSKKNVTAST